MTTSPTAKSMLRVGALSTLPLWPGLIPFSMVAGAISAETGITIWELIFQTLLISAGASQLASLGLLEQGAPLAVIVVTGVAINLRFMMYSASLGSILRGLPLRQRLLAGYLVHDMPYGLSIARWRTRDEPVIAKFWYFVGTGATVVAVWYSGNIVGYFVGALVPPSWSIGFAMPLSFLAIIAPMLHGRAHLAAAATAACVSLACVSMPYSLGLLVGAGAGIAAGLLTERADA